MPDLNELDTGAVAIKLLHQEMVRKKRTMDETMEEVVRKEETMDDKLLQDAFMQAVKGKENRCRDIIKVMSKTEWLKIILGCARLSQLVYIEGMNLMQQAIDNISDEVDLLLEEMKGGKCGTCGGSGEVDSGAPDPQGNFINVVCPDCEGR